MGTSPAVFQQRVRHRPRYGDLPTTTSLLLQPRVQVLVDPVVEVWEPYELPDAG